MPKTSVELCSLLTEKMESDRRQIESQTSEQLRLHAEALANLSADALATTRNAIAEQQQALLQNFSRTLRQQNQQQALLQEEIRQQTKTLLWILRIPLVAIAVICLLVCLATWLWSTHRLEQTEIQVQQMTIQFCSTPAGQTYCRRQP